MGIIDLGVAKGKLRKKTFLSAYERQQIQRFGSPDERGQLTRLEAKENFRYGNNKQENIMQVTVEQLNHPGFINGLQKLDVCSKYPTAKMAWDILQMTKQLREMLKDQRDTYVKLVKEYASLDEQGNIKFSDDKEIVYKDEASKEEHQKKFDEFMAMKLEVKGEKIPFEAINDAGFSPMELDAISCLLDK